MIITYDETYGCMVTVAVESASGRPFTLTATLESYMATPDWGLWFLHNVSGPAVGNLTGAKDSRVWFVDNVEYTFEHWLNQFAGKTHEDKLMLKLQYG